MKKFVLALLLLSSAHAIAQEAFVSVCNRHPKVREALERQSLLKLPCHHMTPQSLKGTPFLFLNDINPSEIVASDFSNLESVQSLFIVGDPKNISILDHNLLAQFPNLSQISLDNIDLSQAPKDFLKPIPKLTTIVLRNCKLREFPQLFRSSFREIDVSQNNIRALPSDLPSEPRWTTSLNLENNQISNISEHIGSLMAPESLRLMGNSIERLSCEKQQSLLSSPSEIAPKTTLSINTKSINMDLACDFSAFTEIEQLILHGGSDHDVSENFKTALRKRSQLEFSAFVITDTFIDLIAERVDLSFIDTDLKNLRLNSPAWANKSIALSIKDSQRSALPDIFIGAKGVFRLSIQMPNLHHIPESTFQDMPTLIDMNFINTPLSETSKSTFRGVRRVFGLPTNFGVTETGGTSEEWAP